MAILIIEGSIKELQEMCNELLSLNFLGERFIRNWQIINNVPDLEQYDRWHDFLYHLEYLVKNYITDKS